MSKLDPKPTPEGKLWDWEDLNTALQYTFEKPTKGKQSMYIAVDSYEMSKGEIIQELETNNYQVTDQGNVLLVE